MEQESEKPGSYFLCRHSEVEKLIKRAETEKERIMNELKAFYRGAIDVVIYSVRHVMGTSIAGKLTVNGETVKEYDPIDLCFLDMNNLMLERLARLRKEAGL